LGTRYRARSPIFRVAKSSEEQRLFDGDSLFLVSSSMKKVLWLARLPGRPCGCHDRSGSDQEQQRPHELKQASTLPISRHSLVGRLITPASAEVEGDTR
jgi:hypothetical protein